MKECAAGILIWCATALAAVSLCVAPAAAQEIAADTSEPAPSGRLRVFVDCRRCDLDYLRRTVTYVDYVRDRAEADIDVLVTDQATGGGGTLWTAEFIGLGRFDGQRLTLSFNTEATATADDRRQAFARTFQLGLAGPAATTSAAAGLSVQWTAPAGGAAPTTGRDPWNAWVLTVSTDGFMDGERSNRSRSYSYSVRADRTTNRTKVRLRTRGDLQDDEFQVDEETRVTSANRSWDIDGLAVRSLGARWSAGLAGAVSRSTFSNVDRSIALAPAIEYDVFPYAESSRRVLTVQYAIGVIGYQYVNPTIYDRLRETVPRHALDASLGLRQPWGELSIGAEVSQHLNHTSRYHVRLEGEADVQLFKGFSFDMSAEYSRINDQISLERGNASEADVLLRVRQLATSYEYSFRFGISYRFGSVFNNVVNPRFDDTPF